MNTNIVYKIRRKSDGLYSTGGTSPKFTKIGKVWRMKGHLTSHLNLLSDPLISDPYYLNRGVTRYDQCEIVTFEMIETLVGPVISIAEYLGEIKERREVKEQKQRDRRIEIEKETRKQQYEKLRKEFG